MKLPEHVNEQAMYRVQIMKEKSPKCYETGECPCGCDAFELTLGSKGCEQGCYTDMLNKQDWEQYKIKNNVIFTDRDTNGGC